MKRWALVVVLTAAVLVVVPGAQSKAPPDGIDVCGVSGCVHLDRTEAEAFWIGNRGPMRPPPPSSFYVVRWRWLASGPEQTSYYVPTAQAFRWSSEGAVAPWTILAEGAARPLDQALARLEAFPAPTPTEVMVGRRVAQAPETYLRLYRGPAAGFPPVLRWLKVTIRSDMPSPWTDGQVDLKISARGRLVMTNGWVHRISLRLANRARRGLPLAP